MSQANDVTNEEEIDPSERIPLNSEPRALGPQGSVAACTPPDY